MNNKIFLSEEFFDEVARTRNKEKKREVARKWYEANKEKRCEAARKWYEANKEKKSEVARKWYEANKEKKREASRKWHEANKEKIKGQRMGKKSLKFIQEQLDI